VTSDIARRRFQDLAMPHLDDAYALARWLTGKPADAEDVVQEACLRALRAFEGRPPEKPRAFFLAVTRNTAHTWLRKNRPLAIVLAGGAEDAEARGDACAETSASPEDVLIDSTTREAIAAAIEALPIVFREVLVMRDINGLSYREIAEATEAPVGTVMSRLARARKMLGRTLEKHDDFS
jgi:RNA polymerase sigma factor (sigma-70 family)